MIQILTIKNWHPTPLNTLLRVHWSKQRRLTQFDKDVIGYESLGQGIAKATGKRRLSVELIYAPGKRRLDLDASLKTLMDALVVAGLLKNDSPRWLEIGSIVATHGDAKATIITLEDVEG